MSQPQLLGAIEAGGTKFLCALADTDGTILDEIRVPTTTPEETLTASSDFFLQATARHGPLATLSIGSFGPLSLNQTAADYGAIVSTPKPGWSGADLLGHFRRTLGVPMALDTDVNCAGVGELLFGSGRGLDTFCYVTVGTGIGVGLVIGGVPHGGANHPEAGHIRLPRAAGDEDFAGICPYHGDCLEGMASGPAMRARWGMPGELLEPNHAAWRIEADYLAALCANLTYIVRPDRIILGGGVMQNDAMYDHVRAALRSKLAGYDATVSAIDLDGYVVRPTAGASAGLTGALAIAFRLLKRRWPTHWTVGSAPAAALAENVSHG
ncbi:transcriptional regulator [Sphingomonas oleivorans]|uniref:fructokinase n=1 Tax=Sphingomonas oleivorans TaxID=1735121 RepID=A0A2T5FVH2_9SPHN|nr:ROK family protein [Sphingomonas oleivorans]PTQ09449.1 transcriptional regulator [Sphingomonas oleivorans]